MPIRDHSRSGNSKGKCTESAFGACQHLCDSVVGGFADNNYWSSSENNANNAWNQNFNNGNQNNNNKNNNNRVRAVRGFERAGKLPGGIAVRAVYMIKASSYQLELFPSDSVQSRSIAEHSEPITLSALFEAYESCRRNKRNTANALAFEVDYEQNLVELCEEINNGSYQPGRSIAFIVERPVKREIFAADFRDRVVHHLIINKLNKFFEKEFIFDSYSCRKGKGTHKGIKRLDGFIRQCSKNYTRDCWILKLDISGFFMSIDRARLYQRLELFIREKYHAADLALVLGLCRKIIFNDPAGNCIIKGRRSNWDGLPNDKSLFHSRPGCGLPIGNLTSQVFANFYLNIFDHFMKHTLGLRYYGRYVDDVVVVHPERFFLNALLPVIRDYLHRELGLTLHPRKILLEHYSRGVKYLGVVIKPRRIYIANGIKGNMYLAVERYNSIANSHKPFHQERSAFQCSINSYLGLMKHYKTYTLRRNMLVKHLSPYWLKLARPDAGMRKLILKNKIRFLREG